VLHLHFPVIGKLVFPDKVMQMFPESLAESRRLSKIISLSLLKTGGTCPMRERIFGKLLQRQE